MSQALINCYYFQEFDAMLRPQEDDLSDETFPPLPPPHSPGQGGGQEQGELFGDAEEGELSKLADVPAAKPKGVKRPQPKLDSQRLTSDRGLPALRPLFHNVHFKGKGHEAEDLRLLMLRMENWAHRLFPKLQFEDFIEKVEKLGAKREVQTCLKRIRLDMPVAQQDFQDREGEEEVPPEFLTFQDFDVFSGESSDNVHSTLAPPAASTPSLTEEQLKLIELNRQRALQRRLARLQPTDPAASQTDVSSTPDQPAAACSAQVLNTCTDQEDTPEELHQPPPCPPSSEAEPPAGSPAEPEAQSSEGLQSALSVCEDEG
ncbi:TIMELESS-interacting protein [Austrofundulus limnaeus]|uniref:TIMELESS-interacting protein n=1 Tax=Austrofundulus limnaeus TaxID=52670 RepID=A0A2I4AKC5_AUSLI|nr:PREDICTED: TIMELESS-interacting protein [Austrofundulus limnaeus]